MSRRCQFCGKKAITGNSISRRGMPKSKGGVGLKTTGITKRLFMPNLQSKRVLIGGKVRKMLVCTRCIKSGNLPIPVKRSNEPSQPENKQ